MPDWGTISSLATAGGTLVLAVATFVSVRSARQAARATERALLAGIRPVLLPSRFEDPAEKVGFQDEHWVKVPGGGAIADATEEAIYFAIALRNVGTGLGVLDRWDFFVPGENIGVQPHRDPESYRRLTRDLYISGGSLGFWQGTIRDPSDPAFAEARDAIAGRQMMIIDMLYGDHEGGQRTITRMAIRSLNDERWIATVARHWNLDRADPR
jgi:hypothetical protein